MKNKVKYNKLVRDKIPAIIEENGKKSITYTADHTEFKSYLLCKLVEESKEMLKEPCVEELADIMEVLESIKEAYNFKDTEIMSVKEKKKNTRGGFDERLILEYVYED